MEPQQQFQHPEAPLPTGHAPIPQHLLNHKVNMELEDRRKEQELKDLQAKKEQELRNLETSKKDIKDTEFEALD